jgi:hypothetical protein
MSDEIGYDSKAISDLLRAAFTAAELRRLCRDNQVLNPVVDDLGTNASLNAMVDTLIEYCEKKLLLHQLLLAVQEENPEQFARFAYRLGPDRGPARARAAEVEEDVERLLVVGVAEAGHARPMAGESSGERHQGRAGLLAGRSGRLLFAGGLVCGVVLAALVWGLFYLLTGSPPGSAQPTCVATPVAALASPAPTETATSGAGQVLGDATQGPIATEAPPAAVPTETEPAAAPTGTSASPTGMPAARSVEGTGTAAAGPGGPTATGTGSPPSQVTPTPGTTAPVLTVAAGQEASVVRLTTGLGVKKELAYDGAKIGDYALNELMHQREESLGQHQFVVALDGGVNMVMPLCVLRSAEQAADGQRQRIVLADGTQMDGELLVLLEDANGESYDLGTAERAEVVSLAREDVCRAPAGAPSEGLWQLEVGDPVNEVYKVVDPRFVLSYYTSRKFYLTDEAGMDHLANLQDIDLLTVDTAGDTFPKVARVRVGEAETSGKISSVRDDLLVRSSDWYLAGDLVDRDVTVVVSNGAGPLLTLRREGTSPP